MLQQKALGRGLASLIPAATFTMVTPPAPNTSKEASLYFSCPIQKLVPNRDQPRKIFTKENLEELASSIRENGIIQPLIVRKTAGDQYELIAGERRLRAAQLAELKEVPVVVLEKTAEKNLELALIENIQRQDLNPIEEALAYKQLMERAGYTQEQCAQKVGKERSTVANTVRLLTLPEEIRGNIIENKLSMGHARALLGLENAEVLLKAARKIIEQGLSVRQTEELVRGLKEEMPVPRPVATKISPQIKHLEAEMTRSLGTKVKIQAKGKKGKVIIEYYSTEDLNRIYEKIG